MKRMLFLIALITCVAVACRKGIGFDNQYLRGRVFLTDTITGNKRDVPVANKTVYLSSGDTLNYLYSVKTDGDGYFVFNLLSDNTTDFKVYAYDTVSGIYYSGSVSAHRGDKSVVLPLRLNGQIQNGLVLYARDPLGNPLPLTTVRIYNNPTFANSNSGSNFISATADSAGKAYRLNLPPGDYWINAERNVDTFYYQRIGKRVTVSAAGFVIDTIQLQRRTSVNAIQVTLVEGGNRLVSGAEVRIYNSQAMAQINDPGSIVASMVSGPDGKVTRPDLPAGTYFLNAFKRDGNDTLVRLGKVMTLPATTLVSDTMLLARSALPVNGFTVRTKDVAGGILPGTTLHVYTSELLALLGSPTGVGSINTLQSDNAGLATQGNLPPGDYYVNARKEVGSALYLCLAKRITVAQTGVVSDEIILVRQ